MIIVLKSGAAKEAVEDLINKIQSQGVTVSPIVGRESTVLGLVGDTSRISMDSLSTSAVIEKIMRVQEPYKRVNRKFHPEDTIIDVCGVQVGGKKLCIISGPCSVESPEQVDTVAKCVKENGGGMLRGGAFKPRSSPYSFQGLKAEGLVMLDAPRKKYGLPVVSEITNIEYLDMFLDYADVIQVGARNMQNFEMLKRLGKVDKPILLKRGFANTIEELLMSAEYILQGGNGKVMLCERGIRTFENYTRNTLDISSVPILKARSHLPVIVDPSHASGWSSLVPALSKAAVAAGADGLMIEMHPTPETALCDGAQSLTPAAFVKLMEELKPVAAAVGREL